jgi:hypothetical protein
VRDVARAVRRAPVRASSRTVWLPLGRRACHFPNVLPVDQSHAVDNAAGPSVQAQDNVACLDVLGDHRPTVRERDGGCDQRARDDDSDCLLVHGQSHNVPGGVRDAVPGSGKGETIWFFRRGRTVSDGQPTEALCGPLQQD